MYQRRKRDANHPAIEQAYRDAGCSVFDASAVGGGFPDLVVGLCGRTYLVEVKNPEGRNKIEDGQQAFARGWRGGDVVYVRSVEDALAHIAECRRWPE